MKKDCLTCKSVFDFSDKIGIDFSFCPDCIVSYLKVDGNWFPLETCDEEKRLLFFYAFKYQPRRNKLPFIGRIARRCRMYNREACGETKKIHEFCTK